MLILILLLNLVSNKAIPKKLNLIMGRTHSSCSTNNIVNKNAIDMHFLFTFTFYFLPFVDKIYSTFGFRQTNIILPEKKLPVQIGQFYSIHVHNMNLFEAH